MNTFAKHYSEIPIFWNYLYPFLGNESGQLAEERLHTFLFSGEKEFRKGKNALYLHIPFCETICSFCPFIKSTNYEPIIEEYIDCMIREMETVAASPALQGLEINTVFVGGGTPSVLPPKLIEKLCTAVKKNFKLAQDYEWTFECEAKTATEERIAAMAEGGANRSSFGVQTLNEKYRKMFNLTASRSEIERTVENLKKYFTRFNADLLYQLPGQTFQELLHDLKEMMALGTTSIDAYQLEYIVCSRGWLQKINNGQIAKPPLPADKVRYTYAIYDHLRQNGWTQKYIYTFMAPGHADKRFIYGEVITGGYEDQLIGFGTGAYTYMQGMTWVNHGDTKQYINRVKEGQLPVARSRNYHAYERKLIFFPKSFEISKAYMRSLPIEEEMWSKLEDLRKRGILMETEEKYILTEDAKPWYPSIMLDLIPERERPYLKQVEAALQKEANWYEPIMVEV